MSAGIPSVCIGSLGLLLLFALISYWPEVALLALVSLAVLRTEYPKNK